MNRLATIEARGAIESGAAAILANEALAAMRPRGSEEKKQELERARSIGYKRFRRPLEEVVEEQKQRKLERESKSESKNKGASREMAVVKVNYIKGKKANAGGREGLPVEGDPGRDWPAGQGAQIHLPDRDEPGNGALCAGALR